MKKALFGVAALAMAAGVASARPLYTMNFDQDSAGNPIANGTSALVAQPYSGWGVTFSADPYGWATNTGMHITSTDTGAGYNASLGQVLHAFSQDWLSEDGDPSFLMSFSTPIDYMTMDVIGDDYGVDGLQTFLAYYDSSLTLLGYFESTGVGGVQNIGGSFSAPAYYVGVAPGDYGDWVGIDNIKFNTVPAPASLGLIGLAGLAAGRRRR